jgi:hypothetical protein
LIFIEKPPFLHTLSIKDTQQKNRSFLQKKLHFSTIAVQISVCRAVGGYAAPMAPLPKGGCQIADFRQFDWGIHTNSPQCCRKRDDFTAIPPVCLEGSRPPFRQGGHYAPKLHCSTNWNLYDAEELSIP